MDEILNLAKAFFFFTLTIYCLLAGLAGAIFSFIDEKDLSIVSSIFALFHLGASLICYRLMFYYLETFWQ